MNIEFSRDLENKKRVLMIEIKETHAVQNVNKCFGYGHVCKDCANLKSNKPKDQKAFNITLNDTGEEVLDESPNYLAFVASYDSDDSKQLDVQSVSDNKSNRVSDLQNSFKI